MSYFPCRKLLLSSVGMAGLLLLIGGVGCGGGNDSVSSSVVRPTPTPSPRATPTPQPTPSRFLPGVTGTRGDLPIFWETVGGVGSYVMITPDSGLPENLPVAHRITAPLTYGDRAFVKWELEGSELSRSPVVDLTENGHGGAALRAVYQSRLAGADGFQPAYLRPTFHHWNHFPLKVHFDRRALSDADITLVRTGIDQWTKASGGAIHYVVTDNADVADIEVSAGDMEQQNRLGYTQVWWDGEGIILRAVITIASITLASDHRNLLAPTSAHEFGHALGIIGTNDAGHSDDVNDLMYQTITSPQRIVTERDMNSLTGLYPNLLSSTGRTHRTAPSVGPGTATSY